MLGKSLKVGRQFESEPVCARGMLGLPFTVDGRPHICARDSNRCRGRVGDHTPRTRNKLAGNLKRRTGTQMTGSHELLSLFVSKNRKALSRLCSTGVLAVGLLCRGDAVQDPDVAALLSAIGNADRVAVLYENGATEAEHQIYVSTNPEDIEALRKSISIVSPQGWFRCGCEPTTVIRLFKRNKDIGEIDLFGGTIIRFTNWSSDAEISNTAEWFEWLDRRGIKTPREELDQGVAEGRKNRAAEERWMKAMPSSLVPLWPSVSKEIPVGESETAPFDSALSKQFPDKDARILILMAWFGNGMGPWSGFPVYETVPEQMLLRYSTPELIAAASSRTPNEDETEGAARLFAGWHFNQSRPQDNALLPAEFKRHLLEHSLKSTDGDKRIRAEDWLSPKVQR